MTSSLRVLAPGLFTTVQDLGRPGYQRLGIAVSGAMDPVSFRAANALVGNLPDTGALEVAYVGPTLQADAEEVRLSFAGANAQIEILPNQGASMGRRFEPGRSVRLRRGEVVQVGSLSDGAVMYIGVEGGFNIPPVLGSVSTYVRGGFGGWHGRKLRAGDCLPLCWDRPSQRGDYSLTKLDLSLPRRFRCTTGPQANLFSDREMTRFFESEYVISPDSDRVGMRLCGPIIHELRNVNVISDGIAPGSVQVPGNGQPIVLLADRQTVGGYPKIATVISADLPALGRIRIGAKIAFELVSIEVAQELRREAVAQIDTIADKIKPISPLPSQMPSLLFDCNLIDGVVSADIWLS